MNRRELLGFMRARRYAVVATTSPTGYPHAAVVGVAITDTFEIIFDTLDSTRKMADLRANGRAAFTFGSLEDKTATTLQLEGEGVEPLDAERERVVAAYLRTFPDGRERQKWPGITYVCVAPHWLRFSDFSGAVPHIVELDRTGIVHLP